MFPTAFRLFGFVVALSGASALHAAISFERSLGEARVVRVAHLSAADIVILDAGYETGLRQGMVCNVSRAGTQIGEVMLVDLRPRSASALILDLVSNLSLQPGDSVVVKTVSSKK